MKALIFLFSTITIFQASLTYAQSGGNGGARDSDLDVRVKRISSRVDMQIQRDADVLTQRELLDVLEKLRDIAKIVRVAQDGLDPDPRPPVKDPPHTSPPSRPPTRVSVRGTIESRNIDLVVESLEDLSDQCSAIVQSNRLVNVDDIALSVDFGPTQTLRNNSSYWKTTDEICGQILAAVTAKANLPVSLRNRLIVTGSIESLSFSFKGSDRIDINNQCESFHRTNKITTNVDDISLSVNFGPLQKLHNGPSYWKTSFEVCQQIVQNL